MQDLSIEGLLKIYSGRKQIVAINHVDLNVEGGEMLVLLGPSGCGKTTLLRCIAGLENAQGGRISLGGKPVFDAGSKWNLPTHRRDIGMVFQNYSLWPHMTVRQNVEYPLSVRGRDSADNRERAEAVLETVQCRALADRLPAMLSGGQQQRVALARALACEPKIMLLDEPLSNLDALLRVDLRAHLRSIHRRLGFTGVYVTHDQLEAFSLGTRIAVMNAGKIEQLGTPREIHDAPGTEYVASFLGIRNSFQIASGNSLCTSIGPIAGDVSRLALREGDFKIFFRPNAAQMTLASKSAPSAPNAIRLPSGTVLDMSYSGAEMDYVIDVNSLPVHVTVHESSACYSPGDEVSILLRIDDLLIYSDGCLVNRNVL